VRGPLVPFHVELIESRALSPPIDGRIGLPSSVTVAPILSKASYKPTGNQIQALGSRNNGRSR
jgi:hypothetical protein